MEKINYGALPKENKLYPVTYTIKQDGTKITGDQMLLGSDLTEPQIKQLVKRGYFNLN